MNRRGFLKLFGKGALALPFVKNLPTELPPNPEAARLEFEQTGKIEPQISSSDTHIRGHFYNVSGPWVPGLEIYNGGEQ